MNEEKERSIKAEIAARIAHGKMVRAEMSLGNVTPREWYAGQALNALIMVYGDTHRLEPDVYAHKAFRYADAMREYVKKEMKDVESGELAGCSETDHDE